MYTEYLGPINEDNQIDMEGLLNRAARLLQQGALIAVPTETTYGLAASILNETALKKIYAVKNRNQAFALPVQVANFDQLKWITRDLPPQFEMLSHCFFPGPLTVVVKKNPNLSNTITAGKDTVAVRISSNNIVKRMIELIGCPLAIPSANISGNPSPICAKHVLEDFNGKIDGIVDGGETEFGLESTVLSIEDPKKPVLLRFGVISQHEIEQALNCKIRIHPKELFAHQNRSRSNRLPTIRLFSSWDEMKIYLQLSSNSKRLVMSLETCSSIIRAPHFFKLTGKNLYEGLRVALRNGCAEVLVLSSPALKDNQKLYQRLKQVAST